MLARLQAWLDGTRDLEARFEQTLVSGALGTGVVESGSLSLLRPGRLRWDYSRPDRKVAIIDGDRTRLYLAQDRQLWEGRLDDVGRMLPALLAGAEPLSAHFVADGVEVVAAGRTRLRLLPASAGSESFEEVVVELEADASIVGAEVLDGSGNRMAYRFSAIRRNRGVSARTFDFEPPQGTERLRQP
jgi:outer membrane lipoprotein-sorting protein